MITITNIRNANPSFDETWAIVRSMKHKSKWIKQVPDLSPTTDLFFTYRSLLLTGKWNQQTFDKIYTPRFITDLKRNTVAKQCLEYLYNADQSGKHICLVCFCANEALCHRSIIAGILAGSGCQVQTDTNRINTKYFDMYMSA